jgi:hypothetical protein
MHTLSSEDRAMVAVGFPPVFEDSMRFRLGERKLLRAVEDTLNELGWHYSFPSRWRVSASVPMRFFVSWGERVVVDIEEDGWVSVRSESLMFLAWIDWGKNASNVRRILRTLADVVDDMRDGRTNSGKVISRSGDWEPAR